MARTLAGRMGRPADDLTLAEVCSVFETQRGRLELATAVRSVLEPVRPAGGLLLVPSLPWHRIFTTNFDLTVERAYKAAHVELEVRRSNADFSRAVRPDACEYIKLHGCVTQDTAFGHQGRMLLTVRDYEEFDDFRQVAFRSLELDMLTKDVLVVGQSLADVHLKELVNRVSRLHAEANAPGRLFILAYDRDEDRASIVEQGGATVTFGGVDDLLQAVIAKAPARAAPGLVLDANQVAVPKGLLHRSVTVVT